MSLDKSFEIQRRDQDDWKFILQANYFCCHLESEYTNIQRANVQRLILSIAQNYAIECCHRFFNVLIQMFLWMKVFICRKLFAGFLHICEVTRIWRVTPAFLYFRLHSKHSPAFTRVLIKTPAITHILFDGNEIAQTNLFAGRKEKYWS